jgi:hypothetical protein
VTGLVIDVRDERSVSDGLTDQRIVATDFAEHGAP